MFPECDITNFDKLHRLISERISPHNDEDSEYDMLGMTGLGPLDKEPDPDFKKEIEELQKKKAHKYKEIAKAHFGIDLVSHMVAHSFDNQLDGGEWAFAKDSIEVKLIFDITSGKSLSHVIARDLTSKEKVGWSRVDTFNNNHSPKEIFNFIFRGYRPSDHQSFAESKETE